MPDDNKTSSELDGEKKDKKKPDDEEFRVVARLKGDHKEQFFAIVKDLADRHLRWSNNEIIQHLIELYPKHQELLKEVEELKLQLEKETKQRQDLEAQIKKLEPK